MKKCLSIFTVAAITVSMSFASFAATNVTVEDIVNNDSRVSMIGSEMIRVDLEENGDGIRKDIVDAISNTARSSTGYSLMSGKNPSGTAAYFRRAQLQTIVDHDNWVGKFVEERLPEIVHDGMSKDNALINIGVYLVSNYRYDESLITADRNTAYNATDAYYLFNNGFGTCTAFSCAFRSLVEAIPFKDGVVNWRTEDPIYLKVALVQNDQHMWDAIQNDDGTWKIYDAATAAKNGVDAKTFDVVGGEAYDLYGTNIWHY